MATAARAFGNLNDVGSDAVGRALVEPWEYIDHQSAANAGVRQTVWRHLGDMARIEDSVRQNYSGRYAIELLQNAHDAHADGDVVTGVRFVVTTSALLVANEGVPFTADRIRSLTRLGSSEKARSRGTRRLIGYKGVGFASVFEVTDRPQIISQTARFAFDRREAQRRIRLQLGDSAGDESVPARYFPLSLEDADWRADDAAVQELFDAGASSVIRLPLRKGWTAAKVASEVASTLVPEVLLFMPAVESLRVTTPQSDWSWGRREVGVVGAGTAVSLTSGEGERRTWVVREGRTPLTIAEAAGIRDELWARVRWLNVAVALPWERDRPGDAAPQPLYAYFPTQDQLGRGLLVHGDFYLDTTRQHVASKGAQAFVSQRVAAKAARLTAELAGSLADHGYALLDCLAPQVPAQGFGVHVGSELDAALASARIVRKAAGAGALRAAAAERIPGNVSVEDEERLVRLVADPGRLVHPGDDRGKPGEWLAALGTRFADVDDLCATLDPQGSGLSYASVLGVLHRWLESLAWGERYSALQVLRSAPVVQDTAGHWRTPDEVVRRTEGSVRMPRALARTELKDPRVPPARAFIAALEIEELSPKTSLDILAEAVRDGRFGRNDEERQEILDFVWEVWKADSDAVRGADLSFLRAPARRARGRRATEWRECGSLYFPRRWTGDATVESLYAPFSRPDFLATDPPPPGSARTDKVRFFEALGVSQEPRAQAPDKGLPNWGAWKRLPDVIDAFRCIEGRHEWTERRVDGVVIDRLDAILARVQTDPSLGETLAKVLLRRKDAFGGAASIRCAAASHGGRATPRKAIGYMRWRLEETPWIPVSGDPLRERLARPRDAWSAPGRGGDRLLVPRGPFAGEEAQRLGLVSADRPPIEAAEIALRRVAEAHADLAAAPAAVVDGAVLLARRLDRSAARSGAAGRTAPPLPCRVAGSWAWSDKPATGILPPPLPGLAVLPPGSWSGLRRAYGLPVLRDIVEADVLAGHLRRAEPWLSLEAKAELVALLALLDLAPRDVASRLASLEERVHEFVTVRWRLRGQSEGISAGVPFHMTVRYNRRGARLGARINRDIRAQLDPLALGQVLAEYLDAPDQEAEISMYLSNPSGWLKHRGVGPREIDDAEDLIRGRRGFREAGSRADPTEQAQPRSSASPASDTDTDTDSQGRQGGTGSPARRSEPRPRRLLEPDGVRFGDPVKVRSGDTTGPTQKERQKRRPAPGKRRPRPEVVDFVQPDPEIERRAMETVTRYGVERLRARVEDVHEQNLGWDLEFHFGDGKWWPVEVKGSSGDGFFIITPNEWRAAQEHPDYLLCQVTGIANPARAKMRVFHDLGAGLDEDLLSGLSWAVTGWRELEPDEIDLSGGAG